MHTDYNFARNLASEIVYRESDSHDYLMRLNEIQLPLPCYTGRKQPIPVALSQSKR